MKKLAVLPFVLLCMFCVKAYAQTEIIGSVEYGRIFNINYDPLIENKAYALTLGNHIVVTENNGESWELLYSFPEKRAMLNDLKILGNDKLSFFSTSSPQTNALYILDIESLEILNKMILPVPLGSDEEWIENFSIYEQNTDIALVQQGFKIGLQGYAKVYYTINGGQDWSEVYYNETHNSVFPNNIAISPADPQKLFIARGNGPNDVDGGLFVSIDAGTNWEEKLPGITLDPIAFNPENSNEILLGSSIGFGIHDEYLYKSTDGGATWDEVLVDWTDETLNNIIAIVYNPQDTNHIIVLEENEIVLTRDGFQSVENFVYPVDNTHSYYYGLSASFNPFNQNELFINGNYHALFSNDGGETVSWNKNRFFATTGSVCVTSGEESHLYYGVQFGYVHRNLSNGLEAPYEVMPLDYMSNNPGISYFADNNIPGRIYSLSKSFMGASLYMSNNHGLDKIQIYSIFASHLHCIATDPSNPDIAWASFSNFGEEPQVIKIDFSNPEDIISSPINLPETDLVNGIIFDPQNPQTIYMAVGAKMYKSANGGDTWESISNGLDELVQFQDLILDLSINPMNANQFSIATNKGIFTSTDAGQSWSRIYNSLVYTIAHSDFNDKLIVSTIHASNISSFGIVYSKDGGTTWNTIKDEDMLFVESSASAILFKEDTAVVYIGSYDLGLVSLQINLNTTDIHYEIPDAPANTISAYPNPAIDYFNFITTDKLKSVEVFNTSGQNVLHADYTTSINVGHLPEGIYFCKVISVTGESFIVKMVKK